MEFERDIENLCRIADALPRKRFKTFVLFAKLNFFTTEEIDRARKLNSTHEFIKILLTSIELESYNIYDRTKSNFILIDTAAAQKTWPKQLPKSTFQLGQMLKEAVA
ncbi:MAG: hypothetical protein V1816_00395 [Pseudomonadota bacterium]